MSAPHALLEPLSYIPCHIEDLLSMPQGAFQHKTTCEYSQSECVFERNISKASHAQLWFTIETLPHPCNALSEGAGCTGTRAHAGWLEQEFQPQTHRSKPRSRGRYQPCAPHVGPITTERLHPGITFMLPDLGLPMGKHVQRPATTPHARSFVTLQLRGASLSNRRLPTYASHPAFHGPLSACWRLRRGSCII